MSELQNISYIVIDFTLLALVSIILKGQLYKRQVFLNEYFSLSFDVPRVVIVLGLMELVLGFIVISDIECGFAPVLLTIFLSGSIFLEMLALNDKSFNLYSIASIYSLSIVTLSEPIGYAFFVIIYGGIAFCAQKLHPSTLNFVSCVLVVVIVLGTFIAWVAFGSNGTFGSSILIILIPFSLMQFTGVIIRFLQTENHNSVGANL